MSAAVTAPLAQDLSTMSSESRRRQPQVKEVSTECKGIRLFDLPGEL